MTDDVRDRFLAGIAAQLPVERVKELHLFGAIRQGGSESGIAVIAVERDERAEPITVDVDGGFVPPPAVAEAAAVESTAEVVIQEQLDDESRFVADEVVDETATPEAAPSAPSTAPAAARYTVYTARYRLTLKGLDRGKWEMSVTEEADAPLLTVDAVVRGVSRRSGDADETVRLSGDEFRAALPETARA
jgi:hypothetical protein